MRPVIWGALAAAALLSAAPGSAAGAAGDPCAGISKALPSEVRVLRIAAHDAASAFTPPFPGSATVTTPFCRVEGVIEKEIGFELWLPPAAAWNGRLLTGGVGGQAGSFNYRELARGVARGYASASTDTGHKASDRHWLLGDRMRAANYAGRANHVLAVKARALLAAFYRRAVDKAFFVGCSGGGRQALTEVQRYPEDYDGVIAGAPGVNTPQMSARRMWEMGRHSAYGATMTDAVWARVSQAAIDACDGDDGVHDGVIDDPRRCRFDPAKLGCGEGPGAGCLTPEQVAAVREIFAPLHDEQERRIDDGLLPGIHVQRAILPEPFTPGPPYLAIALFGDGVHRDPNWDPRAFRIDRDLAAIDRVMDLHADDSRIAPFTRRGGKLILYHGWSDALVAPVPTIDWFETATRSPGVDPASLRLFMAPGVDHCVGGTGPDLFGGAGGDAPVVDADHDMLSALERWVDEGRAPERIIATRLLSRGGRRTRPLCAYPQVARWIGRGSTDEAGNFICTAEVTQ